MAEDFGVQLPEFPIGIRQYEDYVRLTEDVDALSNIPIGELMQMQAEMEQHRQGRMEMRKRLQEQGLSNEQILRVEEAQRNSEFTPNDPSNRNRIRQEPQRDLTGIGEGAVQAVEGVADLAMDLSVWAGLDSDRAREEWKANVAEARTVRREREMATLGQLPGPVAEVVGQVVPWLVASTGSAANYLRFIGRNAFLGGLGTSAQFQPGGKELNDRAVDALMGIGFGSLFGVAFGATPLVRRAVARSVVRDFNDADTAQRQLVESLVQEMTDNPEFKFSAAQLTGSRFYQNLELATADKLTKAQQNKNLDTLYNNLLRIIDRQGGQGRSAAQIAIDLRETLKRAKNEIYAQATSQWGKSATRIIETYGDDAVIDGREYLAKIDTLIAEQNNTALTMGQKPSDNLIRYRNYIDTLVNPSQAKMYQTEDGAWRIVVADRRMGTELKMLGPTDTEAERQALFAKAQAKASELNEAWGGPNAEETLDILKGLNDLIGGKTAIFEESSPSSNRNIGRALMGVFANALEGNPANDDVAKAISQLREGYRMDMAAAEALDRTLFNRMFGGKKLPADPGKKLDLLLKGEEEDLVALREFLEESAEGRDLLYDLRTTHISRIWKGSTVPNRPAVDTPVDLNKFAKNLSDTFGRAGQAGRGLHNPATQADIKLTADALQVIAGKQFRGTVPGGVRPEEWTINLISRSPEFFGRFLTRAFASGQTLEQALLDPAWRKAVQTIADGDLQSPAGKGALLYLTTWWRESENEKARAEELAAADETRRQFVEGERGYGSTR